MSAPGSIAPRIPRSGYLRAFRGSDNQDVRRLLTRARATRSPARLGLRFTELAIVLVSLGVAAMGASTLVALQRSADQARRAELLVAQIGENATNIHDLTTQALDGGF